MGRGYDEETPDSELLYLLGLKERMKRIFDEHSPSADADGLDGQLGWTPAVDVVDTGAALLFTAEVPGVDEGDIDVRVVGETLVLRGERNPDPADRICRYHRVERHEGLFQRAFRLPADVLPDSLRFSCADGILRVVLPKKVPA